MAELNPYRPEAYDYFYTRLPFSSDEVFERAVRPGIAEAEQEFGIRFQELDRGELPVPSQLGRTAYVLASSIDFFMSREKGFDTLLSRHDVGRKALSYLVDLGHEHGYRARQDSPIKLTIPTSFYIEPLMTLRPTRELSQLQRQGAGRWGIDIDGIGRSTRASMPYADTILGDEYILTNSPADVADNIRCETFRLAYNDERDDSPEAVEALRAAKLEARASIGYVGQLFDSHKLWHRAPTDGAMFVKTDYGWLVSQTGARKDRMSPDDFSLIREINPDTNTIVSTGNKPPSSDAPELLTALQEAGDDVRLGVHFHSNGLTRVSQSRTVKAHRTPDVIRYGRFTSAPEVVQAFEAIGDDWIVLKEHGVFWMGKQVGDLDRFIGSKMIGKAHAMQS